MPLCHATNKGVCVQALHYIGGTQTSQSLVRISHALATVRDHCQSDSEKTVRLLRLLGDRYNWIYYGLLRHRSPAALYVPQRTAAEGIVSSKQSSLNVLGRHGHSGLIVPDGEGSQPFRGGRIG